MLDLELQTYLRGFEPLRYVIVSYDSDLAGVLEPHRVKISGTVPLYGELHGFSTDFDLRELSAPRDLERLAALLIESFERAAAQLNKKH